MKAAVDKVHKGKGRTVDSRFAVMCAHYLFDADFCKVASGWECNVLRPSDVQREMSERLGFVAVHVVADDGNLLSSWLGRHQLDEECNKLGAGTACRFFAEHFTGL